MKIIIVAILSHLVLNGCAYSQLRGIYSNEISGTVIKLNSDNSYSAKLTVGHKVYEHEGKWEERGEHIILNSKNQPNTGNLIKYIEFHEKEVHPDSLIIEITSINGKYPTGDGDSLVNFAPGQIVLNDGELSFSPNGREYSKILFPKQLKSILVHGRITDYPIYYLKNKETNRVLIELSATYSKDIEKFPYGSYFTNEKLSVVGDTLMFRDIVPLTRK